LDAVFSDEPGLNASRKKIAGAFMLGVGLDFAGRRRITTGENFAFVVGSQEMHVQMTEKALRISEKLKARCKQLETVTEVILFSADDPEIFHGYIF
jgi:hypothetical protein